MSINLEELQCLRKKQGVYFLYNESKQLVYIGESGNMYVRLLEHIVESKKIFSYFKAVEIDNKTSCQLMEIKLISELQPSYNQLIIKDYESYYHSLPTIAKDDNKYELFDLMFIEMENKTSQFDYCDFNTLFIHPRQQRINNFKKGK